MEFNEIKKKLFGVISKKRFEHSVGVSKIAVKLARYYGIDLYEASIAGLLHDCAREIPHKKILEIAADSGILINDFLLISEPVLLHAIIGAKHATENFGITNDKVLKAIQYHTTGKANMNLLEKIIYIADFIEPGKVTSEVKHLRKLAFENLDRALLIALDKRLQYLITNNRPIHIKSIESRNFLLINE